MRQRKQVSDSVISAIRWTATARIVIQVITWVATIATARILLPEHYGIVALATITVGYFTMLADLGLGAALIRNPSASPSDVAQIDTTVTCIGIIAAACIAVTAPWVASLLGDSRVAPISQLVALQCALGASTVAPSALLIRSMKFDVISKIGIASSLVAVTTTVVGALLGWGAWALAIGSTVEVLVRSISQRYTTGLWDVVLPRRASIQPYISTSKWLVGERTLWYAYSESDTLIVGRLLGAGPLGSFSMAKQLASIPVEKVMTPLNQIALPAFSALQSSSSDVRDACLKFARLGALFSVPVFWGLATIALPLILVVLGPKWTSAAPIMAVLCISIPCRVFTGLYSTALTAVGRADVSFHSMLVTAIVVPLATIIGTRWGAVGAAIGWSIGYPIASAFMIFRALAIFHLPVPAFGRALAGPIVSAVLMVISVKLSQDAIESTGILPIGVVAVSILVGGATYFAAIWVLDRKLLVEAARLGSSIRAGSVTPRSR